MKTIIFSIILYFVEFLIAFSYNKKIFEYRKNFTKTFVIMISGYTFLIFIYLLFSNTEWINILFFAIVNCFCISFGFISNRKSAIFNSLMLTLIMYLTEAVTVFFISSILKISSTHYKSNFYLLIIDAIICKTLYFILAKIISFIATRKNNKIERNNKYWILIIMPLSSMLCTLLIHYLLIQSNISNTISIIASLLSIFQLIANIIVFWIYESSQKDHQQLLELQITNQRNALDLSYLKLLEEKNDFSAELIHNIKNHLLNINSIAKSKEVSSYIENIYGEVESYSFIGKTSNKMLDLIINKYISICKNKGISLSIETFSENLSFINDVDLSTLLNNIFDNSIESAEKCHNKFIDFILKINENCNHIIEIKNSCEQKPLERNHKLLSTKNNAELHGIGTKSIEKIVKKYDGDIEWTYHNIEKTFQIIIVFPQK